VSKFIFVTGGVVSSLGKGIAVASIGRMLKSRDISVSVLKLDPYLNVDPGTMSPYQHGEVFVTIDGSETDLDLGHYERFIDVELTELSNVTAGQIYSEVIANERAGQYLGGTIQTVPHVTNLIKDRILKLAEKSEADVVVVEVGGTVGDIEGQPFIEAIRQVRNAVGQQNTFYVHVTLLPYLGATGELKTKPTQHSVHTLRGMGIQPDAILCRADQEVGENERRKISLYCDVAPEAVISLPTLPSVYEVPLHLEAEGLGKILTEGLNISSKQANLDSWRAMVRVDEEEHPEIDIALVGKYVELQDSYLSVVEALHHAGLYNERKINLHWIGAEDIEKEGAEQLLGSVRGIVVPGGFGKRGFEGMIQTANYARKSNVPYLGLCLGLQIMVVEYARNEVGIADATSLEIDPEATNPVIAFMPGQEELHSTGGTMRLGNYPCVLREGTRVREAYDEEFVDERHRHRYEFNNEYRIQLEDAGLVASGTSPDGSLVEVTEVYGHPFMIGSQFHPEFGSRPERPHPLFREFVRVARNTLREGSQRDFFDKDE
jgi:CTP synthase